MQRLVGFLGLKGVGKDTAAKLLEQHFGVIPTSFAAELYKEVASAYGVSVAFLSNRETKETALEELRLSRCADRDFIDTALAGLQRKYACCRVAPRATAGEMEVPRSPRWALQQWGTEYRRKSAFGYEGYWVDRARAFVARHSGHSVSFSDVREQNEVAFLRSREGILIRIRREDVEARERKARARGDEASLHSSETGLDNFPADAEILNVPEHADTMLGPLKAILGKRDLAA